MEKMKKKVNYLKEKKRRFSKKKKLKIVVL